MKKTIGILIAVVVLVALIVVAVFVINNNKKTPSNLNINNVEELTALVDKIYEGVTIEMPMLQTMPVDMADVDAVKSFTGLDSAENLEYVVYSEPMMSSIAYSLVLVKVKDGANVDSIAKAMNDNVDARKWICVTAEKVYSTSSGDIACLVMSNESLAKNVFSSFKTQAGTVGTEYERAGE